jgi:hypothetical protein
MNLMFGEEHYETENNDSIDLDHIGNDGISLSANGTNSGDTGG